jgi:hypothetical protein
VEDVPQVADDRHAPASFCSHCSFGRLACRPARWVAVFLLVLPACGRKATVEDCQRIVKRITELELKNLVPEQQIGSEVSEAQQTFRQRALSDCVGRRISENALTCVENATTTAALIDDCFD